MVMDWREMVGQPTVCGVQCGERWSSYYGAWSGGKQVGSGWEDGRWDGRTDPIRGWVIAASWLIASSAEYVSHDASFHALTLISKQHLLLVRSHTAASPRLGLCINVIVQSPGAHDILLGFHPYLNILLACHVCRVCLDGNNRGATLREERNDGRVGYICSKG